MPRKQKTKPVAAPQSGWAVYLRTSSDENQKPEMSRARQRFMIEKNVLERSSMPVYGEYVDVLSGKTPMREPISVYWMMLVQASFLMWL